jgi:hypothetical protein
MKFSDFLCSDPVGLVARWLAGARAEFLGTFVGGASLPTRIQKNPKGSCHLNFSKVGHCGESWASFKIDHFEKSILQVAGLEFIGILFQMDSNGFGIFMDLYVFAFL